MRFDDTRFDLGHNYVLETADRWLTIAGYFIVGCVRYPVTRWRLRGKRFLAAKGQTSLSQELRRKGVI